MILTARATALALAFTAILSFPSGTRAQDRTTRELFPNTTDWGRAAVEFESDDLEVVVAYYYSQRHHDSRWLLIELAVSASKPMRIDREDITLITPDGQAVPVATQRAFRQDHPRTQMLVQNARTARHGIGAYFTVPESRNFQFFVMPADGIAYDFFYVNRWRIGWGDVFFASPTGAWAAGTYTLVVQGEDEAQAMLPIDLE